MNYKSKTRKRGKVGKLVKSRKYSKLRKYSKKRRSTYKYRNKTQNLRKKRISITRKRNGRKMYGGEGECDNKVIRDIEVQKAKSAIASFPEGFKTFVDILETCPDVIQDGYVQREYTQKIELKDGTRKIGYIGLLGLQFINYLNARITKLRIQRDELIKTGVQDNDELLNDIKQKIGNLKTAISLMDQVAVAPGVGEEQLKTVRGNVGEKYYDCYVKLYHKLADKLDIEKRDIPLSTSACDFSKTCDSDTDSEVCDTCCIPDNLDFAIKRQNNPSEDENNPKKIKM
jgi:hypothetical protein